MAIKSHAFGRVTLTDDDAEKFSRQVKYGRASPAAKSSVERGSELNRKFKSGQKIVVSTTRREKVPVGG